MPRPAGSDDAKGRGGLDVEDLTVRFGGLDCGEACLPGAPAGAITGLIGPNGAGKTTIFNACTGVVSTDEGRVRLGDCDLAKLSTPARAARGLGRTFQRMELFDSMSVGRTWPSGPEAYLASRHPWSQFACGGASDVTSTRWTRAAIARCGIEALARSRVGDLSTGRRRSSSWLEPWRPRSSSCCWTNRRRGFDVRETERFGDIISHFVSETGSASSWSNTTWRWSPASVTTSTCSISEP